MSKYERIEYTCPECGETFEYDFYKSVNITIDPFLKEKVIDGSLFGIVCPKCGNIDVALHPFVYHDMERDFIIQLDCYSNLLELKASLEENKQDGFLQGLMNETKIIGVTSLADMITVFTCLENGLDWRVMQMALLFMQYDFTKYCADNKLKAKTINYSGLTGKKDEDGDLIFIIDAGEGEENEQFFSKFPMSAYELCLEEFGERLNLINPFIFDNYTREHFCNFYEEDFQLQEEHKNPFVYVEDENGNIIICPPIPTHLEDRVGVGSAVLIQMSDGGRVVGRIKRIVNWNFLCISVPKQEMGKIVSEFKELDLEQSVKNIETLNQDELLNALINLKKNDYNYDKTDFPTNLLQNSHMLMCSADVASIQTQKTVRDGKIYLAIYTDTKHLPKEEDMISYGVFSFDDCVRLVKNDPSYSGVIINQHDDNIVLDYDTLYDYIKFRTLTNSKEVMKLLNELTSKEIEFMSELSFNCIKSVYFEGLNPKELEKKYGIDHKQVDKALVKGYAMLREIIFARF